jgi:hypothetical protein
MPKSKTTDPKPEETQPASTTAQAPVSNEGLIGKVDQVLQQKTGVGLGEIGKGIENALLKDGQSAVNQVIKQGMKKVIRNFLK